MKSRIRNRTNVMRIHKQYCGSMTFWGGSGSADPCLWLMDPDFSAFCNFFCFLQFFLLISFWRYNLHHFSKIRRQKESQNSKNQGFSYYFCMMIEGSGSIPLTSGSGSGRPKNMWIRIRIRHWIRNSDHKTGEHWPESPPMPSCSRRATTRKGWTSSSITFVIPW